jgi:hypothetical protein
MDKKLKDELREWGLLLLSLDEQTQEKYRKMGLEPFETESHFSPGTPEDIIEKYNTIEENVRRLHQMELKGQTNAANYTGLVAQIRSDLSYIRIEGLHRGYKIGTGEVALTGIVGVNRDPLYIQQLKR